MEFVVWISVPIMVFFGILGFKDGVVKRVLEVLGLIVTIILTARFAAAELATRIDDAAPRLVLSASCGVEGDRVIPYKPLLDAAIGRAAVKPEHCVILQRPQECAELLPSRDLDWQELMAGAEPVDRPTALPWGPASPR